MKPEDIAYLIIPYRGYRVIRLVEKLQYKWLVEIVDSGLQLEVWEDDFTLE